MKDRIRLIFSGHMEEIQYVVQKVRTALVLFGPWKQTHPRPPERSGSKTKLMELGDLLSLSSVIVVVPL